MTRINGRLDEIPEIAEERRKLTNYELHCRAILKMHPSFELDRFSAEAIESVYELLIANRSPNP